MRNPFRRRRRLSGAEADWDEQEHIPIDDDYVAIPVEQLPTEAVERLGDVTLYDMGEEGTGVFVNIDAVEAEINTLWTTDYLLEHGEPSEEEIDATYSAAYNNRDHWVKGGIDEIRAGDDETRYSCMRVNLTTGRIGEDA
jgi:hypothetical protein